MFKCSEKRNKLTNIVSTIALLNFILDTEYEYGDSEMVIYRKQKNWKLCVMNLKNMSLEI
jgi:hypothetical protein